MIQYVIETLFSAGLFVNAVLFMPQAIRLFRTKNSHGFSLITFAGFNAIQFFTVLHAYLHKDYILMIGNILSFLTCGVVAVMIVWYRSNIRGYC